MAGEYLPPVVTELTGDAAGLLRAIAEAKTAMKELRDMGGDIPIKFDIDTRSLARARTYARQLSAALPGDTIPIKFNVQGAAATIAAVQTVTTATNQGRAGWGFWGLTATQWLKVVHNLVMVFGAQVIADTIGIIAFGAAVSGTLGPVFSNISNLGKAWSSFSGAQQVAALNTYNFINSLKSHDVQVLAVYDSLLSTITSHMKQAGGVTNQAAFAFMKFAAQVKSSLNSPEWQRLIGSSSGVVGQDLSALLTTVGRLGNALVSLAHNFNFLGLWALSGIGMVAHALVALNNANPTLARFALLTLSAYHAFTFLQKSALVGWFIKLGQAIMDAAKASAAWAAITGGSRIMSFLQLLTGLGAGILIAIGAFTGLGIAIAAFVIAANSIKTPADQMVASLTAQDHAVGANIAGYQKLIGDLRNYENAQLHAANAGKISGRQAEGAFQAAGQAIQDAQQHVQTLNANFRYLERTFGLTQTQAYQVAKALGLVSQMGSRVFTPTEKAAISSYIAALRASQNPMTVMRFDMQQAANAALGLASQVQGLANAFNDLLAPLASTLQAQVQWKNDNIALATAIKASNGQVGLSTVAQRASQAALATSLSDTIALSNSTLQSTHSYRQAAGVIQAEIGVLRGLHSQSSAVRQAIRDLQAQLNSLRNKTVTLHLIQIYSQIGQPAPGGGPKIVNGASQFTGGASQFRPSGMPTTGPSSSSTVIVSHAPAVIQNHIYIDGKEVYQSVQRRAVRRQKLSGTNGLSRTTR